MATSAPTSLGRDLACVDDIDDFATEVTGAALVAQDTYHRLTNDSVLGSTQDPVTGEATLNPDAENFGFDVTRLAGATSAELKLIQPTLVAVVQRDPRILTADVQIQYGAPSAGGLVSVGIAVAATTATGPFSFIIPIGQVTAATLAGQVST
jgi:hypothetical protein